MRRYNIHLNKRVDAASGRYYGLETIDAAGFSINGSWIKFSDEEGRTIGIYSASAVEKVVPVGEVDG